MYERVSNDALLFFCCIIFYMKKLTLELAKQIARDCFQSYRDRIEGDFARIHSASVAEIAVTLAKKANCDQELVETAAWVHDIGYLVEKDNHAEHSVKLLEQKGFELSSEMRDCILNHGTGGKPESQEAKILQMADKLSILNIPTLKLILEQEKVLPEDVAFIKKMTDGAVGYLDNLRRE